MRRRPSTNNRKGSLVPKGGGSFLFEEKGGLRREPTLSYFSSCCFLLTWSGDKSVIPEKGSSTEGELLRSLREKEG